VRLSRGKLREHGGNDYRIEIRRRCRVSYRFLAAAGGLTGLLLVLAATPAPAAKNWVAPRTPDGQPDLQGIWSNATITPLERPKELAGKEIFTEKEAAEYEKRVLEETNKDRRDAPPEVDVGRAYNDAWWDRGTKVVPTRRTSMVVDPPDG